MSNLWQRARFERDHRWAPGRMSDYLDEELAARSRTRLEQHVRECEECRGVLKGLERMLWRLHGLAPPAARPDPPQMAARVHERLSHQPES